MNKFFVKGDCTGWEVKPMHRFGNPAVLDAAGAPGELRYRISNNEGYSDWADPYARAYRFEDGQEVSQHRLRLVTLSAGWRLADRGSRLELSESGCRNVTQHIFSTCTMVKISFIQRLSGEVGICIIMLVHRHWSLVSITVPTG